MHNKVHNLKRVKCAYIQGVHIVFFGRYQNIPDSCLSLFSLGVSVYTNQAVRTPASAAVELAEFRKITTFYEHPVLPCQKRQISK